MWNRFIERLHAGTEAAAHDAIANMSADDVLAFWSWNDREAAAAIGECPADGLPDMVDVLRDQLSSDVMSEIRYRARKAGA
jgi:hypothetical protein